MAFYSTRSVGLVVGFGDDPSHLVVLVGSTYLIKICIDDHFTTGDFAGLPRVAWMYMGVRSYLMFCRFVMHWDCRGLGCACWFDCDNGCLSVYCLCP